jgi:hypothetical protein
MMKKHMKFIIPIAAVSACIAWASVSTDYDHHADFGRYHTYYWIGVRAGNSLWQDRIMNAVNTELASKGWTMSQGSGDAAVSAFGKVNETDTLETFYDGFPGWGWRGWGGGGFGEATTTAIPQKIGDLTVDIFDGSTKHLIWRGDATDTLTGKPEKNEKKLEHSIDDMFKRFPPNSKG